MLFVCTHNSARSQLAAATWAQVSDLPVASAGTHPAARVHPLAVTVGRRHGLRLGRVRPHDVDVTASAGDLMVAVCDNAYEGLVTAGSLLHWSVPDPALRGEHTAFEAAYAQIEPRVRRLADALARS